MRVLIGYDGSKHADAALADLARAGLPPGTEAVVLTIADLFEPPCSTQQAVEPMVEHAVKQWRNRVEAAISEAKLFAESAASKLRTEHLKWAISTEAFADSPAWGLIKRAEGLCGGFAPADLMVLGAAGRSATLGRTLFGSVALRVLHHARRSVRIGRQVASSKQEGNPIRLIVGVDRSDDSTAAVRAICARKWPVGTQCRVVTVFDSQLFTAMAGIDPIFISSYEDWPRQYAEQAAVTLQGAGLDATAVVCEGPVASCLIRQAEEFAADCIFVGARGLRRVERFLLGSVSSTVAMHAPCTVEVIRS